MKFAWHLSINTDIAEYNSDVIRICSYKIATGIVIYGIFELYQSYMYMINKYKYNKQMVQQNFELKLLQILSFITC